MHPADFTTPLMPPMIFRNPHPLLKWLAAPLLVTSAFAQGPKGKAPAGPLPSELYTVKPEAFEQTISTVGTLRANESVTLVSELSRRLVKIQVKEGSEVAKDDLLFKLDDSDLLAELGEIDARLKLANTNKQRVDVLLPRKAISQQEFDSSTAEVAVLEAQRSTQAVQDFKNRNPRPVRRAGGGPAGE